MEKSANEKKTTEAKDIFEATFEHRVLMLQNEVIALKTQGNNRLGYKYRSCEQILEAVKPICKKYNLLLTLQDEIFFLENRFYVKAIATIRDTHSNKDIESVAYAREDETSKFMSTSQLTGSASSYARKYALSGLLLLDDNKDADKIADENSQNPRPQEQEDSGELASAQIIEKIKNSLNNDDDRFKKALAFVGAHDESTLTAMQAERILQIAQRK